MIALSSDHIEIIIEPDTAPEIIWNQPAHLIFSFLSLVSLSTVLSFFAVCI